MYVKLKYVNNSTEDGVDRIMLLLGSSILDRVEKY